MPRKTWIDTESVNSSECKVLAFLAEHPKQTPYRIEKGTKLVHSTINYIFRGCAVLREGTQPTACNLVTKGLVVSSKPLDWRNTKRYRREYSLSFKGLMLYFAKVHRRAKLFGEKSIKLTDKIIDNYRDYHPIFQHWKELKDSIEFSQIKSGGLHGVLSIACNLTYQSPFAFIPSGKEWNTFRNEYPMATLRLEGNFTLNFMGYLAGLSQSNNVKIVKPVLPICETWATVENELNKTVSRINNFAEKFALC